MDLQIKDKTFFVAASSRGLGFGVASVLAKEGAKVWLGARDESAVQEAASRLQNETGSRCEAARLDASCPSSIRDWAHEGMERLGPCTGLLCNAGGPPTGTFATLDDGDFNDAHELLLMSTIHLIRNTLPSLKANQGSIVIVTSTSAREPIDGLLLSNVYRGAVRGLCKTIARELGPSGVRCNTLAPGSHDTARIRAVHQWQASQANIGPEEHRRKVESTIPLRRLGTEEEFGRMATFLLSPASSYITGQEILVDGGLTRSV